MMAMKTQHYMSQYHLDAMMQLHMSMFKFGGQLGTAGAEFAQARVRASQGNLGPDAFLREAVRDYTRYFDTVARVTAEHAGAARDRLAKIDGEAEMSESSNVETLRMAA